MNSPIFIYKLFSHHIIFPCFLALNLQLHFNCNPFLLAILLYSNSFRLCGLAWHWHVYEKNYWTKQIFTCLFITRYIECIALRTSYIMHYAIKLNSKLVQIYFFTRSCCYALECVV